MITERHSTPPALRLPARLAPLTSKLRRTYDHAASTSIPAAQNSWWRKGLALIAVALLSVPSAVGVFRALEPTRGALAAGLAAGGFESVYLASALLLLSPDRHRFAQRTALSAVAVAVLLNTVADYSLRTAQHDTAGPVVSCWAEQLACDGGPVRPAGPGAVAVREPAAGAPGLRDGDSAAPPGGQGEPGGAAESPRMCGPMCSCERSSHSATSRSPSCVRTPLRLGTELGAKVRRPCRSRIPGMVATAYLSSRIGG